MPEPESGVHHCFRIGNRYTACSESADRLEVFGSEYSSITAQCGYRAGAVNQAGDAAFVFSCRTAADDGRNLGGVVIIGKFGPLAMFHAGIDTPGDFLLRVPRVHAPDPIGAFDFDIVIDDIDPDGILGSAFDYDAVPTCKFQLGGETKAEVAVTEPFLRVKTWCQTLNFASAGTGHECAGERTCHHDNEISRIKRLEWKLIAYQIKKHG